MSVVLVVLQVWIALALAWTCFCRLAKMDATTIREIRVAVWFEAVVALLVAGAPVLPLMVPECRWEPLTTPTGVWLMLLLAAVLGRVVSARFWTGGVPGGFTN